MKGWGPKVLTAWPPKWLLTPNSPFIICVFLSIEDSGYFHPGLALQAEELHPGACSS